MHKRVWFLILIAVTMMSPRAVAQQKAEISEQSSLPVIVMPTGLSSLSDLGDDSAGIPILAPQSKPDQATSEVPVQQPAASTAPGESSAECQPTGLAPHVLISQVPVGGPIVLPVQSLVPKPRHRGFLSRLFGPIIDPITNGLNNASSGLNNASAGLDNAAGGLNSAAVGLDSTSAQLQNLQGPLNNLARPLTDLASPLGGLGQPLVQLRQPILDLRQPLSSIGQPVTGLSGNVHGLGGNVHGLSDSVSGLSTSVSGLDSPLNGIKEPLRGLVQPLRGLEAPLVGLQRPLTGLAVPLNSLQAQIGDLRSEIVALHRSILDIGRNMTLAIVFGSSIIAWAIWTHRKVPSRVEPTITTMETVPEGDRMPGPSNHEAHTRTIIKTEPAEGHPDNHGGQKPPHGTEGPQQPPPPGFNHPSE